MHIFGKIVCRNQRPPPPHVIPSLPIWVYKKHVTSPTERWPVCAQAASWQPHSKTQPRLTSFYWLNTSSVQRCTLPKAVEKLGVHAHSSSQASGASGLAQLSTSPCNVLAAGEVNWDWTLKWLWAYMQHIEPWICSGDFQVHLSFMKPIFSQTTTNEQRLLTFFFFKLHFSLCFGRKLFSQSV